MAEDAVDKWVGQLNALARQLDEDAAMMHPTAWPEALKAVMDRFKKLAREGPTGNQPLLQLTATLGEEDGLMPAIRVKQFVTDGLTACLPPETPLMGQIVRARFTGKEKAEAEMVLFDGRPGIVEVSKHLPSDGAWRIRWFKMDGGDINWTGSAWERVVAVPIQLNLFDVLGAGVSYAEGG